MSQGRRLALIALVVVIAVAGFVIAKSGSNNKDKSATVTETTKGVTSTTTDVTPVPIVVKNGKPVGGVKKITVSKGDPVRFTVTSDVADEIHVHGYDFHKDVTKGGSVSFDFPAKIDGVFVIELENRGEQIASLEVQP
jgi:plastocyanin